MHYAPAEASYCTAVECIKCLSLYTVYLFHSSIAALLTEMASNPPGKCCTVGFKHEGQTIGKIEKVAGSMSLPPDSSISEVC